MRDHYVKAWELGHFKAPDAEYFIVVGFIKVPSQGVFWIVPEDGYGFMVELRGTRCLVDPTPSVLFGAHANPQKGPTPPD